MNITLDVKVTPVEQKTKGTKKNNKKLNQKILNDIKRSNQHTRRGDAHQKLM